MLNRNVREHVVGDDAPINDRFGDSGEAAIAPKPFGVREIGTQRCAGGIRAVADCSLTVERGQILGLIGPNGAGKTTLFNCLSRLYNPNRGEILFQGGSLLARPPHRIAEIGNALDEADEERIR